MSLTTFRQAVAARAGTALSIATVLDGKLEGPVQRRDVVCSWPARKGELPDDADLEELEVFVRVLTAYVQRVDDETPWDPGPLETIAETLQAGLDDIQTAAGPWFFRLVEVEIDVDRQSVTGRVLGWQRNLFAQT